MFILIDLLISNRRLIIKVMLYLVRFYPHLDTTNNFLTTHWVTTYCDVTTASVFLNLMELIMAE